jgi:membrane associated rhomboid family serine protease
MLFPLYDLNPHRRFPWLTLVIIGTNFAVQLWMMSLNQKEQGEIALRYGFVPARLSAMGNGQPIVVPMLGPGPNDRPVQVAVLRLSTDPADVYATFITTMFLHGGWGHLLMNMWMLWVFGNNIEDRVGHLMFVGYYLIGGIVATLCHWAVDANSTMAVIGASGAVAAVLGGYAITYPSAKVRTLVFFGLIAIIDLPALAVLGIWFVMQLVSGVVFLQGLVLEPVAFWAHIGGFVAGLVLMPILSLGASPPDADWRKEAIDLFRFDDPRSAEKRGVVE